MALPEPNWTDEELAVRVAYELCPAIRRQYRTFERAMAEPLIAKVLRLSGTAWLKNKKTQGIDDARPR